MTETPATAEYTNSAGTVVVGDVERANKSTVYVRWRHNGRVEPVNRRRPDGVVFKP